MTDLSTYFMSKNEPFAAGFYENPERDKFYRLSNAYKRLFENLEMPSYAGGKLYPSGNKMYYLYAVYADYSNTFWLNPELMSEKFSADIISMLNDEKNLVVYPDTPHDIGGYGYTHSLPNYSRIAKEGLNSYRKRIENLEPSDFRDGLLCLLDGIKIYRDRAISKLLCENAPEELIAALQKVPFEPAETFYEAMVCRNFIYYIDGCDNPGRLDAELYEYYNGEDAAVLFDEFFRNVDENDGWTAAIGPDYNELTISALKASVGKRRPSLELRVTPDMPQEVWDAALDSIQAGGGSPSLYNEVLYQKGLAEKFPEISEADRKKFCGGGCTETMLEGISHVGSIDAGINTALILSDTIKAHLASSSSFDDFYNTLIKEIDAVLSDIVEKLSVIYTTRSQNRPQPVRTLLIDDCIDKGLDYNSGGARINWSIVNFAGMINTIDSLLAIRELIFEKKKYSAEEFIGLLEAEDESFFAVLKTCTCYGVDNAEADALASDFAQNIFTMTDKHKNIFGDKVLSSSIQFTTYTTAGEPVPATPDGRKSGEPLCDSLSAVHGKDTAGPTALLNSVSKLSLSNALGTPVLNLRMNKEHIKSSLRPLAETFFSKGGMQMQITCVSSEDMKDALIHPEKHENLIVRVGGYSEYFNRLSPEMKKTLIERTEF